MPFRTHPDEKLLLLFHCLKASDYANIDFRVVAASLAITVAAARMKFNRLRAEIETRASNPKADTIPTSGRRETTTECVLKTTEKKRKLEQYKHSIGAKAGGDQIARVGSGPQTENQTDVPEIRTPNKRQTRGKKIDVWAAFNSNTSVALEPCIFYEAETSDYEGLAAATDNGEWFWTDSNSEQENPAKRCRSYQTTEKTNAQDLPSFASSSYSATTLTQDVSKAVSSASDANLPPGLAIDTRSTVGKRINPWSLTPGRTDFTSTALPPSPISTPTPSDSFTSTGAIYGDSDNENLTLAIEHDSHADAIIEDVVNPTTATAPSTENNGAMHGYDDLITQKQQPTGCIIQQAEEPRANHPSAQTSWLHLWFSRKLKG